jgi:hypothetical protein
MIAIGGVFQNIQVNLDNGNGHVWNYLTDVTAGEQLVTIYSTSSSGCAAIYVYDNEVSLTTDSASTSASSTEAKFRNSIPTAKAAFDNSRNGQEDADAEKRAKVAQILGQMLKAEPGIQYLETGRAKRADAYEEVLSI